MKFKTLVAILMSALTILTMLSGMYEGGLFVQNKIIYDLDTTYQTLEEGFGASGCWWAPDVGGWQHYTKDGEDVREAIARLLYDKESGLGLDVYRYNLGAAVTPDKGKYSHYWRTVESFLTEDGSYDFNRDKNGRYMLDLALKYGASQVILFANSPPNSLTKNGKGHSSDGKCNLSSENYTAYSKYFCDIAEHFISIGVPVVALSPVNEPEWEWKGGQEGCHYEPNELVAFYEAFIKEKESRETLSNVKVSIYESGVVAGRIYEYLEALMASEIIRPYMTHIDAHSYWASVNDKIIFKQYIEERYPELKVSMTEWCQMQNGRKSDMGPALTIAHVIMDDLVYLDATTWQYWLAVSCYHYEDGLLYVNVEEKNDLQIPLRYYAFSQFTKYLDKGATRIKSELSLKDNNGQIRQCSFINPNGELVTIFINNGNDLELNNVRLPKEYNSYDLYSTSANVLGEQFVCGGSSASTIKIPRESITTVVYKK